MSASASKNFGPAVAQKLNLPHTGVAAVLRLLDDKATVPFIARYRKEATGALDEVQIRAIGETRQRLVELEKRRASILEIIAEQGQLTDKLRQQLLRCENRAALEDLYLPYRKKRKTRASVARDRGLAPLAEQIRSQPQNVHPRAAARPFVNPAREVPDTDAAIAGACDIIAEQVAEDARIRATCRDTFRQHGVLTAVKAPKVTERTRFEQYYKFGEPVRSIPSHRYLAIARGETEKVLRVRIELDEERLIRRCLRAAGHHPRSSLGPVLEEAVRDSFKRLLSPSITNEVRRDLKALSDEGAIDVFASNLASLLLAAPLGEQTVLGIDPGLRTGCKCASVGPNGQFLHNTTIYPGQGSHKTEQAQRTLTELIRKQRPYAVAVGNGTGGRETLAFVRDTLSTQGMSEVIVVPVNESGASVYSASDVAREEFPDLDLTVRGAISIARRLQDPLAELVKIDPKSIGVGQYQHDVDPGQLQRKLGEVVESCVNRVGVDLNTASASLLSFVAGLGPTLSQRIVTHRDQHGPFRRRRQLLDVSGLGARTFEQAAGFLRIRNGAHPLDGSAVHPERYKLVTQMAKELKIRLEDLIGNTAAVDGIPLERYVDDQVGLPTLRDIAGELKKPGRDPRETFEPPQFREDVRELSDLKEGMWLEGVVTNVTHFGAFVDVGVHQDGLVHVSQLADRFVSDPSEVVGPGDRLRVRVLEVDHERRRISLSARKDGGGSREGTRPSPRNPPPPGQQQRGRGSQRGTDNRGRHQRRPSPPKQQKRDRKPPEDPRAPLRNRIFEELLNRKPE